MSIEDDFARISSWLAENDVHVALSPPLEHSGSIPEPLLPLYAVHDGQSGGVPLFDGFRFLPLADALLEKSRMDTLAEGLSWGREWWSPAWHPFASDGSGQVVAIEEGSGRVLMFLHDEPDRPTLGRSLSAYLADFADSFESGERSYFKQLGVIGLNAQVGAGKDARVKPDLLNPEVRAELERQASFRRNERAFFAVALLVAGLVFLLREVLGVF